MRIRTKVAAVAMAGATGGLLAIVGTMGPAQACGSAYADGSSTGPGWQPVPGGPYSNSAPGVPSGAPGYIGVGSSSGYIQASGSAGATGVNGNITAAGSAGPESGVIAVGNDTNSGATSGGGQSVSTPAGYVCT